MEIILNGEKTSVPEGDSISRLLERLVLDGPVAVQVNEEIINKETLARTGLKPGDKVELLRMMGGG